MSIKNLHKQNPKKTFTISSEIAIDISSNCLIKKLKESAFFFILLVLSAFPIVSAFGATAPYWENNPLIMLPGETQEFPIILQNMVGEKDIILKGEIISGSEIAALTPNSIYSVLFGKEDIKANLKVEIPKNAKKGDEYTISVSFKQIPGEKEEMLQVVSEISVSFPVIIEKEISKSPQQTELTSTSLKYFLNIILTFMTILIISIIILVFFLIKRQNQNFIQEPLNEHVILHKDKYFSRRALSGVA